MFDKECSANETGLNRGEGRSEPIGDRLEDRLLVAHKDSNIENK